MSEYERQMQANLRPESATGCYCLSLSAPKERVALRVAVLGCRTGQSLALWDELWHTRHSWAKQHAELWQAPRFHRMHALMVEKVDFFLWGV